jgi:tetratricopeptide (TPR) repeat protein
MGDYSAAAQRVAELEKSSPPASVAMTARAEEVRLALDLGQIDTALAIVGKSPESQTEPSPQLDAAALDAYLAAWQKAISTSQASAAKHWQQRAIETVRHIEQAHAPRWAHQAEALLASRIASSPGTSDSGELVRAAESFYRVGKVDESLATYEKAIEQARANGRAGDILAPSLAAAAIEEQRKQYAKAAERLRRVALEDPQNAKAAIAHLQAIYDTAQRLADAVPGDLNEYVAMLDEHLRLWPSGTTADRARIWLGKVRERQHQWAEAVAAYGGVSSDAEQTSEAIEGVTRCYLAWLGELKSRQEPTEQVATDAATFLEYVVTGGTGQTSTQWTPSQRQAALDAARIWLEFTASGAPRAERILQAALSAEGETSSEWRDAARCWLALSLVAQSKHDEAARTLEGLGGGEAAPMLSVLEGLERAAQSATPETRQKLAELSLRVAEGLRKQFATLVPAQRRALGLRTAKALENLGRTREATSMLKALAAEGGDDPAIQEAYADALIETRETASVKSALEAYRAIEQRSRPGSERWFRAKYGMALAHDSLGQHDRAVQIIRVTQLLHPEMGGSAMKAKFEAIEGKR